MIDVQEKVLLAPLTSFRLGGEARYFVDVKTLEELQEAVAFAKEKAVEFYVMAGGTNLLISDAGFDGLIIRMKISQAQVIYGLVDISAGTPLIKAVNFSAENGFADIEALAGVPGSFGGAIRGNAGAFGTEIGNHVDEVTALDVNTGEIVKFKKDECDFSYRSSVFKKNQNLIVLSATLKLTPADIAACKAKVMETVMGRTKKCLQGAKSAGSYFMNPKINSQELLKEFETEKGVPARNGVVPAGWIIDKAGLRGKKIGGAQVSEEHTNYIINTGDATAENVIMLVSLVKQQVRDQFGIQLVEEVNYLGF